MSTKEDLEKFAAKIGTNFDATDSYKLKPSGLKAQTATVANSSNPVPSYIGQPGRDANGVRYLAISTSVAPYWERETLRPALLPADLIPVSKNLWDYRKMIPLKEVLISGTIANNSFRNLMKIRVSPSTEYYRNKTMQIFEFNSEEILITSEAALANTNYTTSSLAAFLLINIQPSVAVGCWFGKLSDWTGTFTPFDSGNPELDTTYADSDQTILFDDNLLELQPFSAGLLDSSSGLQYQSSTYMVSGFVRIKNSTIYYFNNKIYTLVLYNREKKITRYLAPSNVAGNVVTTADEYYARLTSSNFNSTTAIFSESPEPNSGVGIKQRFLEKQKIYVDDLRSEYKETVYNGCLKIPADLLSRKEITIEFDFTPNFDMHFADKRYDLFGFGTGISSIGQYTDGRYNVWVATKATSGGKFLMNYLSYYGINHGIYDNIVQIESGTQAPHSWYLKNNMCGEDVLSIRKKTPTTDDYALRLIIDGTNFTIMNGVTPLYSASLSTYTTVQDLADALIAAVELSDFEIKVYGGARLVSNLQMMNSISFVCKNETTGLPDAYPIYIPESSRGKKHHFKFTAKVTDDPFYMTASAFINGFPLYYVKDAYNQLGWDFKNQYFAIGGLIDSEANKFDGIIENITIASKFSWVKRISVMSSHQPEVDVTSSQITRIFKDAAERGFTIINPEQLALYLSGNCNYEEIPAKSIIMTNDDLRWDCWTTFSYRNTLNKLGIKPILFIPIEYLTTEIVEILKTTYTLGWRLGVHGYHHVNINLLSYAQVVADMELVKTTLDGFGLYSNLYCYPMSSRADCISKVIKHEYGFTFSIALGARSYWGGTDLKFGRDGVFDNTSEIYSDNLVFEMSKANCELGGGNWTIM